MVPLIDVSDLDTIQTLLYSALIMMSLDPPYSMGIFETIVNVHFGDGLAVEFFPGDRSSI